MGLFHNYLGRSFLIAALLLCSADQSLANHLNEPASIARTQSITSGRSISGNLTRPSSAVAYTFQGNAGDRVTIALNGSFDTVLHLHRSTPITGQLVTSDDDEGPGSNSLIENFVLPATGQYVIEVKGYSFQHTGSYTMTFTSNSDGNGEFPESRHPYTNRYDNTWTYTLPGSPGSIRVTFSQQTETESCCDRIYVMDGSNNNIEGSPFRGTSLRGQTKTVTGATVKIRLTTDGSVTRYGFKVTDVQAGGVVTQGPTAPSSLAATAVSASQINLSWRDRSNNENGFRIERRTGSSWSQIASVGRNVTRYEDTRLSASTRYFYRVRAYNDDGNSSYSNEANSTTSGTGLPESPHPYTNRYDNTWTYTLPGSPGSIRVTFSQQTETESCCDRIYVMDGSNNNIEGSPFRGTSLRGQTKTVTGATVKIRLTTDGSVTRYGFKVTDVQAGGVVTQGPTAPSSLAATAVSASQINLSWRDRSNNENGFRIERRTGSSWSQIASVGRNVTRYEDTRLSASTRYFYRVRAYNDDGNSSYSNEANATTSGTGLPESPHPYTNRYDNTWTYTLPGSPDSIRVTFSQQTETESCCDRIYVMDGSNNNIEGSPFRGTSLRGQTKTVTGATVKIRLTTDGSVTRYGFKVTDVQAGGVVTQGPTLIFVHGKRTDDETDRRWTAARDYWREDWRDNRVGDFVQAATGGSNYYVVNYKANDPYWRRTAAGKVADQIVNATNGGADGGGNRPTRSEANGGTFWIVAHSMGATVMDFILGNSRPNDPFYNFSGPFDTVADRISGVISIGGAHRGSQLADRSCGNGNLIADLAVRYFNDCDMATFWLQSHDAVQVRTLC